MVLARNGACKWSGLIPGHLDLAHSFQVAIYENLLEELNKTKQFKHVLREGDSKASDDSGLADLENNGCEIYAWERNAACGDHCERRDKVNGAESTRYTRGQNCARSHGERECSLLRQQFARYPQFGPQYRQSDQAIGMARIRAAGAILTSQLRLRTAHISWFLMEAQGEAWRRVTEQRLITQSAAGSSKSHEEDR